MLLPSLEKICVLRVWDKELMKAVAKLKTWRKHEKKDWFCKVSARTWCLWQEHVCERYSWILGRFWFSLGFRYRLQVSGKCDLKDELLPLVSGWSWHHGHGGSVVDSAVASEGGQEREDALFQLEGRNKQSFTPYSQKHFATLDATLLTLLQANWETSVNTAWVRRAYWSPQMHLSLVPCCEWQIICFHKICLGFFFLFSHLYNCFFVGKQTEF